MESLSYQALILYFVMTLLVTAAMLGLSHFLGPRTSGRNTEQPFESGMLPVGTARIRLAAKFYMIAIFFVIFDLEAVYLLAWAVAVREVGWAGYIEVIIFVIILVAALAYLWRLGALDWSSTAQKTPLKR